MQAKLYFTSLSLFNKRRCNANRRLICTIEPPCSILFHCFNKSCDTDT